MFYILSTFSRKTAKLTGQVQYLTLQVIRQSKTRVNPRKSVSVENLEMKMGPNAMVFE